jgi:hypothetical protein
VAVNAAATPIKEATESSAQTSKEAAGGDRVAQRLLAKEVAAKGSATGTATAAASTPAQSQAKARLSSSFVDERA